MRRRGRAFGFGLMAFYAACGLGAVVNYQLTKALFGAGFHWLLAGATGAFVGGIWNYSMASFFVWTRPRPQWRPESLATPGNGGRAPSS